MIIYNKSKTNKLIHSLYNYRKKRVVIIALWLFVWFFFGSGCILYGGYLNKTRQNIKIGKLIISLSDLDFSFVPNKIGSLAANIEQIKLDIDFIDFEKLRYSREEALSRVNGPKVDKHIEVPAKLTYLGETYAVAVSLTGSDEVEPNSMHIIHPNKKWSYSIKVKKGKSVMGLRKFSLLVPRARGYLTDWIATTLLKSRGVIGIRNDFIELVINGEDLGIFYLEERYDNLLLENNGKNEGIIFRFVNGEISVHGIAKILEQEELKSQLFILQNLYYRLIDGRVKPYDFFDFSKLASFAVVSDIMNSKHALGLWNLRFYFNPQTQLCEPIGREWGYLQEPVKNKFITLFDNKNALLIEKPNNETPYHAGILKHNPIFIDGIGLDFKELYIKEAEKLSKQTYLDSVLYSDNSLQTLLRKVHKENPFYKFPIDQLHKNQEYIRDKINPNRPLIESTIDTIMKDSISIFVINKIDLPIEIHSLIYNSKQIKKLMERLIIDADFETNFTGKRIVFPFNKEDGLSSLSSDFFELNYSILGLDNLRKTVVFPKDSMELSEK